jgi:hypothetical protein
LEKELQVAEMRVKMLREAVEAGRAFAKTLAHGGSIVVPREKKKANGSAPSIIRARNVGDLAYQFLRDICPGATVLELYSALVSSGASVGHSEYMYHIVKKLVKEGRVRKVPDKNSQGRYFVVEHEKNEKAHNDNELRQ